MVHTGGYCRGAGMVCTGGYCRGTGMVCTGRYCRVQGWCTLVDIVGCRDGAHWWIL